ncbi:hypothetical protein [Agriterribacter sp.]|uniref:hypothetical protein n=1 Tax=Agriterribacter sp. TaxID=2821509 RepID=UPI002D10FBB7|nr:hypothetical protein [Agriterribacter sp.]HRP55180.1 hypothetical protein [Agriterribacter sp.]
MQRIHWMASLIAIVCAFFVTHGKDGKELLFFVKVLYFLSLQPVSDATAPGRD